MNLLKEPRIWLIFWGGLGVALLIYVIIAASLKPNSGAAPSALEGDRTLLVGEMADFEYAFPPRGAPAISFDHEGKTVSIADFRGKAILVNFWATWCLPCVKELPSLDGLQQELGSQRFEVVAIAAGPQGPVGAEKFLARHKVTNLKLYADPDLRLASAFGGTNVLPVSILYDAQGREVGRLIGEADWMSPEAVRLVQSALP